MSLTALRESSVISGHDWPVQSLAFAHSTNLLATGDTQRHVKVWYDGKVLHELNLSSREDKVKPTERIRGLAFSPTGDTLYIACGDTLRAVSMTSGEVRWKYTPPRSFGFLIISPVSLAVSTYGDVAVSTDAGRVLLWTAEGALKAQWWDNDSPRQLAFLNGEQLIGSDSFSICTWKISTGRKLSRRRVQERIYGFAATSDASKIVLRSIHDIQVWDVVADVMLAQYGVPYGAPLVSISDQDRVAVAGVHEVVVHTPGRKSITIPLSDASVRSLKIASDGSFVTAGCSDGTIRTWNLS